MEGTLHLVLKLIFPRLQEEGKPLGTCAMRYIRDEVSFTEFSALRLNIRKADIPSRLCC